MVEPFVCDPVCNRDPVSNRAKNGKKSRHWNWPSVVALHSRLQDSRESLSSPATHDTRKRYSSGYTRVWLAGFLPELRFWIVQRWFPSRKYSIVDLLLGSFHFSKNGRPRAGTRIENEDPRTRRKQMAATTSHVATKGKNFDETV